MQFMVNKDVDQAYVLISERGKRLISKPELEQLPQRENYAVVANFQKFEIVNVDIPKSIDSNLDNPQGTVARVEGYIDDNDGSQRGFNAILEKIDGKWLIYSLQISLHPAQNTASKNSV